MRICVVQLAASGVSETFLRAHAERLPGVAGVVYPHQGCVTLGGRPVLAPHLPARAWRKAQRLLRGEPWEALERMAYEQAIRRTRANVVLAEYGTTGVRVMEACRRLGTPLVVHFHGYDASRRDVLAPLTAKYRQMFAQAAAVVAVSQAMVAQLQELGCPADKIHYVPCGVDCEQFTGGAPGSANRFLAVGRFVDKKAPQLTLLALARAREQCPEVRLDWIGDGPLWGACRDLATGLGVAGAVEFWGARDHATVADAMRRARALVQHSVTAYNGDAEGTPVAVLEAGATGVPVIATRHAGIPDVVRHGETGLLCAERDVAGMAEHLVRLARDAAEAERMGRAARERIRAEFSMERSLARLTEVLRTAASHLVP